MLKVVIIVNRNGTCSVLRKESKSKSFHSVTEENLMVRLAVPSANIRNCQNQRRKSKKCGSTLLLDHRAWINQPKTGGS